MLDIYDLEIRHKKYKQKQLAPYIAISASTAVVIASIAFFILYDFNSKIEEPQQQIVIQQSVAKPVTKDENSTSQNSTAKKEDIAVAQEAVVKPQPEIPKEEIKTTPIEEKKIEEKREEKVILSPSLNFINSIKSQTPPLAKKESSNNNVNKEVKKSLVETQKKQEEAVPATIENVKQVAKKQEVIVPAPPVVVEEILAPISKVDNKNNIDIKRKNNDEDDIKDVIKRFNVNHNPALSLFVAKRYYQSGEYEKAYNYALTTNEINNNIEESWIIFSKSLVKMNKKDMAIETLKKYIGHSQSSQAKQLLDDIQSGKFK